MPIISGVICDQCERQIIYMKPLPKWLLTSYVRDRGWSIGKYTLCPNCNPRKKRSTANA